MVLYNQIDKKILKEQVQAKKKDRLTLSFYKYHLIPNPQTFRDHLYRHWNQLGVLGRIYIAKEGINAQISILKHSKQDFINNLYNISFLKDVRLNFAIEEKDFSFIKLVIKTRDKIVADGLNDNTFDVTRKGKHLNAFSFNEMIERKDTVLVDMRNHYESEIGHFKGAILPNVDTFRESLPIIDAMQSNDKDKNLVLYCTGGIRCEKASAYFKHRGYKNVFQLEGGIIEYSRQVREKGIENKFIGKNFVFDERLGERISDEIISHCHQCGRSWDTHVNCANDACHLLFLQCERCKILFQNCCSNECKEILSLPLEEQKRLRSGKNQGSQVYKKGRIPIDMANNYFKPK